MKAIQVVGAKQLKLIDKAKPSINNDRDVLVKVMATGICGSDMMIYRGMSPVATFPRVLGHEVAGEVVESGGAASLSIGDRVVMEPITYCGTCYACRQGRGNVCQDLRIKGVNEDGGFQEYICVPDTKLHKFSDDVSYVQAVMIEPYTIGWQATWRASVQPNDVVMIFGAGPIGLIVLDVAKSLGAQCIISDINEKRLALAEGFGADFVLNPKHSDVEAEVMRITEGMGANVVFDAVGIPSIFSSAVRIASVAGRVVSMSFSDAPTPISLLEITKKELDVVGTRHQTNKFKDVIEIFPGRLENIKKMITHEFNFLEYEKAFKLNVDHQEDVGKIVLTYS